MCSVGEVHFSHRGLSSTPGGYLRRARVCQVCRSQSNFNSVTCAELMKAVYLPDSGPVELLLRELAISKGDHQDDDVTPLIIGSDVVLSLWRGVSLTVSLPKLGGRVTSLTVFVTVCSTSVAEIASSAWIVSICGMVMTITCRLCVRYFMLLTVVDKSFFHQMRSVHKHAVCVFTGRKDLGYDDQLLSGLFPTLILCLSRCCSRLFARSYFHQMCFDNKLAVCFLTRGKRQW